MKENFTQNESLTSGQQELLPVEEFLLQNYEFRYNIISGKMEFRCRNNDSAFVHLDKKMMNGVVLHARRELPKEKALKQQLTDCIYSPRTPDFNPVGEWLYIWYKAARDYCAAALKLYEPAGGTDA